MDFKGIQWVNVPCVYFGSEKCNKLLCLIESYEFRDKLSDCQTVKDYVTLRWLRKVKPQTSGRNYKKVENVNSSPAYRFVVGIEGRASARCITWFCKWKHHAALK